MQPRNPKESGIVLLTVLLLMLILSAIMAGFFFTVLGEQQVVRSGRDNVVAFYGAEGGLEQLSAGLAQLFESTASPAIAQINALSTPTYTPPQVTYPTYTVGCPDAPCTGPIPSTSGVIGGSSPLAGLPGIITPFTLTVVANSPNHTEVKLVRQVQLVGPSPSLSSASSHKPTCPFSPAPTSISGAASTRMAICFSPKATVTL